MYIAKFQDRDREAHIQAMGQAYTLVYIAHVGIVLVPSADIVDDAGRRINQVALDREVS